MTSLEETQLRKMILLALYKKRANLFLKEDIINEIENSDFVKNNNLKSNVYQIFEEIFKVLKLTGDIKYNKEYKKYRIFTSFPSFN